MTLLALLQASIPTVGTAQSGRGDVRVVAPSELQAAALTMADLAAEPRHWLGLGEVDVTPLTLVVVADADGFERWSQGRVPRWGAGLTVPARRLIVIRFDAGTPLKTLRHELAHLAFHSRVPVRVPLWFSEGYAAVAAGEHGRLDALQLNFAVAIGRVPGLRELDGALRGTSGDAGAAYALAADAVNEVARRHPGGSLKPLLDRLSDGEDFGLALEASTGLDVDGFDERWQQAVRKRYNLGIWAITGGAWGVIALLLVFLSAIRRHQDAPRRAALDDGWVIPDESEPGEGGRPDIDSMTTGLSPGYPLDRPDHDR